MSSQRLFTPLDIVCAPCMSCGAGSRWVRRWCSGPGCTKMNTGGGSRPTSCPGGHCSSCCPSCFRGTTSCAAYVLCLLRLQCLLDDVVTLLPFLFLRVQQIMFTAMMGALLLQCWVMPFRIPAANAREIVMLCALCTAASFEMLRVPPVNTVGETLLWPCQSSR